MGPGRAMAAERSKLFNLVVALLSTAAFFLTVRLMPKLVSASDLAIALREIAQAILAVGLLWVLIRYFREVPAKLGVRAPDLSSLGWGLVAFLLSVIVSSACLAVASKYGITQNPKVLDALLARPKWLLILIAMGAAISEEIVFRSVLISHVEAASGSIIVAAVVSLAAFALSHLGGWGVSQMVFAAVPGAVLTFFFIWKRDIWLCVIAHFLTDALGLLLVNGHS